MAGVIEQGHSEQPEASPTTFGDNPIVFRTAEMYS